MKRYWLILALALVLLVPALAIPQEISIQGRLTNSTGGLEASKCFNMTFKLYNTLSGGSPLYTEQYDTDALGCSATTSCSASRGQVLKTTSEGVFNVNLGTCNPIDLDFSEDYYVEVVVNDSTLSPRHKISSSAYTFRSNVTDFIANNAQAVGNFSVANNFSVGSGTLFVDSTGSSVGIGTSSPSTKLHIKGADNVAIIEGDEVEAGLGTGQLRIQGTTNTNQRLILGYDTTSNFGFIEAGIAGSDYQEISLNPNGGNVGIGATTPTAKLDVRGGINASSLNLTSLTNCDTIDTDANGVLSCGTDATGTAGAQAQWNRSGTYVYLNKTSDSVGIGTKTPDELLHVSGSTAGDGAHIGNAYVGVWDGGSGYTAFVHDSLKATTGSYALIQSSGGQTYLNSASGNAIAFRINNVDKMTLDSSGNLGVGTTTPSEVLTVIGNASIDGSTFVVNSTTGRVGINTSSPNYALDVNGDLRINNTIYSSDGSSPTITLSNSVGSDLSYGTSKFRAGSSNLEFIVGGSEKARFTTTGLGIGTTNPLQDLEVVGNLNVTGTAYIGTQNFINIGASGNMTLGGNLSVNNTLFVDSSVGRVGIGTSSPAGKLDVISESGAVGSFYRIQDSAGGPAFSQYKARGTTTTPSVVSAGDVSGGYNSYAYTGSAYQSLGQIRHRVESIGTGIASYIEFYTSNTSGSTNEAMRIDSSGQVGIGTTNPSENLHVAGASTPGIAIEDTTNSHWGTFTAGSSGSGIQYDNAFYLQHDDDGTIGGSATTTLMGDSSGRVGIGTTSPSEQLTVAGNASIGSTLYVNSTTGRVGIGTSSPDSTIHIIGGACIESSDSGCTAGAGDLLVGAGSVSAPSLSFAADSDTGIYNSGSGTIEIANDGNFVLYVNDDGTYSSAATGATHTAYIRSPRGFAPLSSNGENGIPLEIEAGLGGSPALSGNGGNGANLTLLAGDGGTGDTDGNGGDVIINAGNGLTDGNILLGTTDGNVGIGTTSPTVALDVNGWLRINNTIFSSDGSSPTITLSNSVGSDLSYGTSKFRAGSSNLAFIINTNEKARFTTTGLGIGTTSPNFKLHTQDGSFGGTYGTSISNVAFESSLDLGLEIDTPSSNSGYIYFRDEANAANTATGYIKYRHSDDSMRFQAAGGSSEMAITSGKVGIGTNSPANTLHVVSTTNGVLSGAIIEGRRDGGFATLQLRAKDGSTPTSALPANQGPGLYFAGFDGTNFRNMSAILSMADTEAISSTDSSSFLSFYTTPPSSTSMSEVMRIDEDGNVGIGTTSPQNKLDVDGAAAIGSTYSGVSTAPTNGLIVQGNVGIGTTTPDGKLEIASSTDPTLVIGVDGSTTVDPKISLNDTSIGAGFDIWYDNSVGSTYFDSRYNNANGDIFFRTRTAGTAVNALTIDATGTVKGGNFFYTLPGGISDDGVYSFTPRTAIGVIIINPRYSTYSTANAMIAYRTGNSGGNFIKLMAQSDTAVEVRTGALTGTTGTDGKVTVSVHTDGKIYIENRMGISGGISVGITLLGT